MHGSLNKVIFVKKQRIIKNNELDQSLLWFTMAKNIFNKEFAPMQKEYISKLFLKNFIRAFFS
jgi:hypothetical protein